MFGGDLTTRSAVSALRSALAAIANAEAVPPSTAGSGSSEDRVTARPPFAGSAAGAGATEVARRGLTDAQPRAIVGEASAGTPR